MSTVQEQPDHQERIKEALSTFLNQHRKKAAVALGLIVVVVVGLVVYFEIQDRRLEESLEVVEGLEEDLEQWRQQPAGDRDEAEADRIHAELTTIVEDYARLYSGQRALYLRGTLLYEQEEWDEAASDYLALADRFPRSHLALVGLSNAAAAYEEEGQLERALKLYERLAEKRPDTNPLRARAVFSAGRLWETLGDTEEALKAYERLVQDFEESQWSTLARSRILTLNGAAEEG